MTVDQYLISNEQEPKTLLICCTLVDEILPGDIGIIISHYEDPSHTPTSFLVECQPRVCCPLFNVLLLEGSGLSKLRYGTLITSQGTQRINGVGVGA